MRFADIQGLPQEATVLRTMVDSGRIPHAILLSEPDGGPAFAVAGAFLQYLYCRSHEGGDSCGACPSCNKISKLIHPDVHYIFPVVSPGSCNALMPKLRELAAGGGNFTEAAFNAAMGAEGKSALIPVAEAKAILSDLSLSALEGGYRAVVIYLPEKMNQEAANRLLKAIEEPEPNTQFVLITHAPEKVLGTILSRCQHIRLTAPEPAPEFDEPELLDSLMEALAARSLADALAVGEKLAALPSRESAKAFCRFASDAMRNAFLVQQGLPLKPRGPRPCPWATKARKTFPRAAVACFDRAYMLIGRNVNVKIIFTDLVNRLSRIF